MAMTPATPREKLDRLLQYVQRARRYWWLVAGCVVIGAALTIPVVLPWVPPRRIRIARRSASR